MPTYEFVCEEHQDFGNLGWRLKNMPAFDPLSGMGVAHDILEHRRGDDSTTGELLALGAMIHVRGEDYAANKGQHITSPAENMGGEIADLLMRIQYGDWVPLRDCPHAIGCREIQSALDKTIQLIRKYLISDRDRDGEYEMDSHTERNVRGWLAEGYRRALKRYKHVNRYQLLDVFNQIEEYADKALEHAKPGLILKVRLKWVSGVVIDHKHAELKMWTVEVWEQEEY